MTSPGLGLALLLQLAASPAPEVPPPEVLVVGTKVAPPFAIKRTDGSWTGTSIELWRLAALELGLRYELRESTLEGLLTGLQDGTFDVAVAAITVTTEREAVLDFSHPFHTTGLSVAVRREHEGVLWALLQALLSREVLALIGIVAGLQFVAGAAVWLVERHRNPQHFGGTPRQGLSSGYWWATVTMTTVGYGDKFPVTSAGRAVALGWMLLSASMLSVFTASVATNMTIVKLQSRIDGPEHLRRARVGTVAATTSEAFLRGDDFDFRSFASVDEGLGAVVGNEIDALVYDQPLLKTAVDRDHEDELRVLPITFKRQDYAIALPQGSPLREALNRVLPEKLLDLDRPGVP